MCYLVRNNISSGRSCIIVTLITIQLSTLTLDENSLMLFALSTCVLVEEYQHVAGLDLGLSHGVFSLSNIAVF